jgi:hypothetical protein
MSGTLLPPVHKLMVGGETTYLLVLPRILFLVGRWSIFVHVFVFVFFVVHW